MDRYSTPEERLLNLIRKKDRRPKTREHQPTIDTTTAYNISARPQKSFIQLSSFKFWNHLLIAIAGILVVYIVLEFLFLNGQEKAIVKSALKVGTGNKSYRIEASSAKPYSYYANQFRQRDIFDISQGVADVSAGPRVGSSDFQQMAKDLRLVGVILDNNPQAIIENKAEGKTYFLHRGEKINDLKIEVITESKAILSYGKERLELSL